MEALRGDGVVAFIRGVQEVLNIATPHAPSDHGHQKMTGLLLGSPRDLVTTYNWASDPTCHGGNLYKASWEDYKWD